MDGHTPVAGPAPAIDHDRLFKDLLTTFFFEFLELFFARLAEAMDPGSVEFLPQEVYSGLAADGDKLVVDILAKARFRGGDGSAGGGGAAAFFMIHVEHQSTASGDFLERFFRYHLALWNKYGLPVYPIVVYSHDSPPRKKQPRVWRSMFPDGEVLRFTCRVVQLNRLPWRWFARRENPAATALMAKMKMQPRDRLRVRMECLRLMATLRVDPRRMRLIGVFVDTYLRLLTANEHVLFERMLQRAGLTQQEKEKILDYTTSWEEAGLARGLAQGREEGREEGALEALREVLLDVLTTRFAAIPAPATQRIRKINSVEELRGLTHRALTAASLGELGFPDDHASH